MVFSTSAPPRRILLATDLASRSDRAFDRALQLASAWKANLTALHVVGNPEPLTRWRDLGKTWPADVGQLVHLAERHLLADVDRLGVDVSVRVESGGPAETIARVAAEEGSDLIVTGMARDETLGRFLLGGTVDALLRHSPVPVLVVRNRVRHPYRKVTVGTDFSATARHALLTAFRFFPGASMAMAHADQVPLATITDTSDHQQRFRNAAILESAAFLKDTNLSDEERRGLEVLVQYGTPATVLHDRVVAGLADLVVVGSHGRSALFDLVVGSTARTLIDTLPCDVMVVRAQITADD